jgi:hypothetical protein
MQTNLDGRGLRPIPIICHCLDPPPLSRYRLLGLRHVFDGVKLIFFKGKKTQIMCTWVGKSSAV